MLEMDAGNQSGRGDRGFLASIATSVNRKKEEMFLTELHSACEKVGSSHVVHNYKSIETET